MSDSLNFFQCLDDAKSTQEISYLGAFQYGDKILSEVVSILNATSETEMVSDIGEKSLEVLLSLKLLDFVVNTSWGNPRGGILHVPHNTLIEIRSPACIVTQRDHSDTLDRALFMNDAYALSHGLYAEQVREDIENQRFLARYTRESANRAKESMERIRSEGEGAFYTNLLLETEGPETRRYEYMAKMITDTVQFRFGIDTSYGKYETKFHEACSGYRMETARIVREISRQVETVVTLPAVLKSQLHTLERVLDIMDFIWNHGPLFLNIYRKISENTNMRMQNRFNPYYAKVVGKNLSLHQDFSFFSEIYDAPTQEFILGKIQAEEDYVECFPMQLAMGIIPATWSRTFCASREYPEVWSGVSFGIGTDAIPQVILEEEKDAFWKQIVKRFTKIKR